ncbi:MAG: hypothetical protein V1908_01570 [Candidatus Peregrinibacteria bacterium]
MDRGDRFSNAGALRELLHLLGDASFERMMTVAEHLVAVTRLPVTVIVHGGRPALQDRETGRIVTLRELLTRALARAQN